MACRFLVPLLVLALAPAAGAQSPALYYEEDGAGPPIVFLADWGHDTTIWFRILPRLRPGFRLVRYDPRGQGRSEAPAGGDYSIVAHREDLMRVLDGLEIGRAHLVGAGFGAAIALSFAREHPDRVLSVAAIHPHIAWSSEDRAWWERFLESYQRAGRPPVAAYTSVLVGRWFDNETISAEPWIEPLFDLMLRRQASDALIASLVAWLGTELLTERAPAVPLLILEGERATTTSEVGRSVLPGAARLPGVEGARSLVADAGLLPHVEAPAETAARLVAFFRYAPIPR